MSKPSTKSKTGAGMKMVHQVSKFLNKTKRVAHSNPGAINALRESIELNEKMREERRKKKKLQNPNFKRKNTFSDSSQQEKSERKEDSSSSSSSSSGNSSGSGSSSSGSSRSSSPTITESNIQTKKVDRIDDELRSKHSQIQRMTARKKVSSSLDKGRGIHLLQKFLK